MDIAEFLAARLDEDERVALGAATSDDGRESPSTGEHWQWVHIGDDDPRYPKGHALVDQPVNMARWANDVYVGGNGPDYAGVVSLRSVEEYPTASVGDLPHFIIHRTEELQVGVAEHIARHDPARVLAEVAAKRAIIEQYCRQVPPGDRGATSLPDPGDAALLFVLTVFVQPYADHPDFDPAWALQHA